MTVDANKKNQSLGISFEKRTLQGTPSILYFSLPLILYLFQIQIPGLLKWRLKLVMRTTNKIRSPNVYIFSPMVAFLIKPGRSDSEKNN